MRFFAPLLKVEEAEDGTIKVYGIASTEKADRSGEILMASAVQAALPDFFAHGTGALREMHGLSAAGTVDEATINDDGDTLIEVTVVDPVAIKKVQTGTYKGFSVGGKVLERDTTNRKIITKIALNEISLVDRPANPGATIDLWKADGSVDLSRRELSSDPQTSNIPASQEEPAGGLEPITKADDMGDTANVTTETEVSATETTTEEVVAKTETSTEVVAETAVAPIDKVNAALSTIEEAVAKASVNEDLNKGLYSVGRFADVLQTIAYLASSSQYEEESEGDNSKVPKELRAWLKDGAKIFKDMAKEEIDELIAETNVKKAEESEALAKAQSEQSDILAKAQSEQSEALIKAQSDNEALVKAVAERDDLLIKVAERIEPLSKTVETLMKRLEAVEDSPAPAKTAGPLAKAVSKEEDSSGQTLEAPKDVSVEDIAKALGAMPEHERSMLLTKAALSQPHFIKR